MAIVEVPLEILEIPPFGVHCLVKAIISGEQINLVVDTGASRTVLDSSFMSDLFGAEALEETFEPSAAIGINNLPSFYVMIPKLWIGDMPFENLDCVAMDLSNIIESYEMMGLPQIKGILGGDILQQTKALIDYGKETLKLTPRAGIIEQ